MMSGTSMTAGMGWPMLLLMLLLWGSVIALVLWGVSGLFPAGQTSVEVDALDILRQRYARGEISRAEFLQASETLHPGELEASRHAHGHPGGRGR